MRMVSLMALLAAGLGLLAWTVLPAAPVADRADAVRGAQETASSVAAPLEEILAQRDIIPTHDYPLRGQPAPDFELPDSAGKVCKLRELRNGCPIVLIFYYGSHCIHCARHLAEMNRDLPLFHEVGAQVVAVSPDPPELARQRPGLTILSDLGNKAAEVYGVFKRTNDERIGNIRRHGTFIIDRAGIIRWANVGDAPFRRNSALLCELARLEGRLPTAKKP